MTKPFFVGLLIFLPVASVGQSDGLCCDANAGGNYSAIACSQSPNSEFWDQSGEDGIVCDEDCPGGADPGCTTIPLDGGLSLLALAGGGLATAAMRRRREEEARQADES